MVCAMTDELKRAKQHNKTNKQNNMNYYVTMTDKFMSGWGMADGKTNKLIIVCDNYQDAETIFRNAKKRDEMKYVSICANKPKYGKNVLESWKNYSEMGSIWKQ